MVNMLKVISGAFGAFRREVVEAVGAHTPTSGNDGDLTLKVRRVCKRVVFAHRARGLTTTPVTLKALIKQRRRWDRNLIKNKLRRHRDLLDLRSVSFSISSALLVLDAVVFSLLLTFRWAVTWVVAALTNPELLPRLFVYSYFIYLAGAAFQLLIAHAVEQPEPGERREHWLYLPLYPLYRALLRPVRLYSYIEELARQASYLDVFAPAPVSAEAVLYDNQARLRLRTMFASLLWPFRRSTRSKPQHPPMED
jgi:hypothetical protein